MSMYIITYDLSPSSANYNELYELIQSLGGTRQILESTWVVNTESSAKNISSQIQSVVGSNAKFFVSILGGEAAWLGLDDESAKWLKIMP